MSDAVRNAVKKLAEDERPTPDEIGASFQAILTGEAEPALIQFAESSPMPFVNGIKAARERIVARDDEDRQGFLRKRRRPGRVPEA